MVIARTIHLTMLWSGPGVPVVPRTNPVRDQTGNVIWELTYKIFWVGPLFKGRSGNQRQEYFFFWALVKYDSSLIHKSLKKISDAS